MPSRREQDRLFLLIAWRQGMVSQAIASEAFRRCWNNNNDAAPACSLRASLEQSGVSKTSLDRFFTWMDQGAGAEDAPRAHAESRESSTNLLVEFLAALEPSVAQQATDDESALQSDPLATQLPNRQTDQSSPVDFATLQPGSHRAREHDSIAGANPSDPGAPRIRYDLVEPLASGGLGEVFIATDQELNRAVALKQIRGQWADDESAQQRFLLEAEVTGKLEHPGVVPIYGLGVYDDGRPYYAMRLIDGQSLLEATKAFHQNPGSHVDAVSRVSTLRKLLGRLIDICQTMEYAHARSVLHRDLKPDNIMLGAYGETLVVDWGLAKHLDQDTDSAKGITGSHPDRSTAPSFASDATVHGSIVGTPGFMSPEQAAGHIDQLSPRSDVYSLGATLLYVLTGKTSLDFIERTNAESIADYVVRVARQPIGLANQVAEGAPKPLAAIAAKATAVDPADRYASAQAMADDLERYLADEPVEAFPDPWTTIARRWIKRHQTIAISTMAVVLASTVGLLIFLSILSAKQSELEFSNRRLDSALIEAREAATAAELGRMQATEAKANELAFSRFLVNNILAVARPRGLSGGLGIDVKLIDAIEQAEVDLEEVFAGRPLAEATARSGLGDTWHALGKFERAMGHHRRAAEIYQDQLGKESVEYWVSMSELALAMKMNGQVDEALQIQTDAFETLAELQGPTDSSTLSAMNNLGLTQVLVGNTDQGLRTLEESLAVTRDTYGDGSPEVLSSMDNLAEALRQGSDEQRSRAIALLQAVIPGKQETLGELHPETLSSINNYATMLMEFGRSELAIDTLREVVEKMRGVLGDDHLRVIVTETNLAFAMAEDGQFDDAIALLQSTIKNSSEELGKYHPATLNAEDILGNTFSAQGDTAGALEVLVRVVEGRKQVLGEGHAETLKSMNNLAFEYQMAGQLPEALALYDNVLRSRRALFADDELGIIVSINNLASAYADLGQPEAARDLYLEMLDYIRDDADRQEYWRVRNNLADCYLQLGDVEQSIQIYREQLQEFDAAGDEGPLGAITRQSLAVALLELERFDEALPLLEAMVEQQRALAAESAPQRSLLRGMLIYLAECQLGLEQYENAEASAKESMDIALEMMPENWRRYNAQSLLGEALLQQGKLDQAATLIEEAHPFIVNQSVDLPFALRAGFVGDSFGRMIALAEQRKDTALVEQLKGELAAFLQRGSGE